MSRIAKVMGIQVAGLDTRKSLLEACRDLTVSETDRCKLHISLRLTDGTKTFITIRDTEDGAICYGDGKIKGIPSFTDVSIEMCATPNQKKRIRRVMKEASDGE